MENTTDRPGNPDLLRADIDAGRTGDKVAYPDPAAAPLGTDAEAAGTPPANSQVHNARVDERAHDSPRGEPTQSKNRAWLPAVFAAVLVVALIVVAVGAAI